MTAYDPQFAHRRLDILRWFRGSDGSVQQSAPFDSPPPAHRHSALLGEIGAFLDRHRLDANPHTLAVAFGVVSGTDLRISAQIEKRVASGNDVTAEWLETTVNDGAEVLAAMMDRLASSIELFARTTGAARAATTDYNFALEEHVGELEQVGQAGVVISELATIARAMLDRTREIERQMAHSEAQTRKLQLNLEKAQREADHDHLTGLPNRRAFELVFEKEHRLAIENHEPLCVAICDIDNFKHINDRHGHDAGDRVLKAVAQSLALISTDRCHVARHGGEEFVLLFRGTALEQVMVLLDHARASMSERRLVNRATDEPFGQITFSGGVADVFAYPARGQALKAADAALYAAKQAGRDRISIARP